MEKNVKRQEHYCIYQTEQVLLQLLVKHLWCQEGFFLWLWCDYRLSRCSNHILQAARERADDILENKQSVWISPTPCEEKGSGPCGNKQLQKKRRCHCFGRQGCRELHSTKISVLESQSMSPLMEIELLFHLLLWASTFILVGANNWDHGSADSLFSLSGWQYWSTYTAHPRAKTS